MSSLFLLPPCNADHFKSCHESGLLSADRPSCVNLLRAEVIDLMPLKLPIGKHLGRYFNEDAWSYLNFVKIVNLIYFSRMAPLVIVIPEKHIVRGSWLRPHTPHFTGANKANFYIQDKFRLTRSYNPVTCKSNIPFNNEQLPYRTIHVLAVAQTMSETAFTYFIPFWAMPIKLKSMMLAINTLRNGKSGRLRAEFL